MIRRENVIEWGWSYKKIEGTRYSLFSFEVETGELGGYWHVYSMLDMNSIRAISRDQRKWCKSQILKLKGPLSS